MPSGRSRLAARRGAAAKIVAQAEQMTGGTTTAAAVPAVPCVPTSPLPYPAGEQGIVSIPLLRNAADYERFRRGELYPISSLFPPDPE